MGLKPRQSRHHKACFYITSCALHCVAAWLGFWRDCGLFDAQPFPLRKRHASLGDRVAACEAAKIARRLRAQPKGKRCATLHSVDASAATEEQNYLDCQMLTNLLNRNHDG